MRTYRLNVNGTEIKRKTARTYTHVIIADGRTRAKEIQLIDQSIARSKEYIAFYRETIEGGVFTLGRSAADFEGYIASAKRGIALMEETKKQQEAVSDEERIGHNTEAVTWAGRPDLAEKAVAKARKDGFLNVRAVALPND